jgi:hypothetical protein
VTRNLFGRQTALDSAAVWLIADIPAGFRLTLIDYDSTHGTEWFSAVGRPV